MLKSSRQEVRMNAPRSTGPRFHDQGDSRPDRDAEGHPELPAQDGLGGNGALRGSTAGPDQRSIPSTPGELVAMQRLLASQDQPPPQNEEGRVAQTLALLLTQDLQPWECQQIALALLQQLEGYHKAVVAELHDTPQSTAAQVACWAIDGDRLMHCRRLLESITLI
jgi:hypothetical protein